LHLGCLTHYCKTEMDGGKSALLCPIPECRRELSQRECRAIVGVDSFAKLDRMALEEAVLADPTLHLCTSADCTYVAAWSGPEDGPPRLACPMCHAEICLMCGAKWHGAELSCDEAAAAADRDAAEEATLQYLKRTNVRRCKQCGNGVVKSYGCNKMKCRCGYRFCYECGAEDCKVDGYNCGCTPATHGYIDNITGGGDFTGRAPARPGEF